MSSERLNELAAGGHMTWGKAHAPNSFRAEAELFIYPEERPLNPGFLGEYAMGAWIHNPYLPASGIALASREEVDFCLKHGAVDSRDHTFKAAREAAIALSEPERFQKPDPRYVEYKRSSGMMPLEIFLRVISSEPSQRDIFEASVILQDGGVEDLSDDTFLETMAKIISVYRSIDSQKIHSGWLIPETYILLNRLGAEPDHSLN